MTVTVKYYNNSIVFDTLVEANTAAKEAISALDATPTVHTWVKRVTKQEDGSYLLDEAPLTDAEMITNPSGTFLCKHHHDGQLHEVNNVAEQIAIGKANYIALARLDKITEVTTEVTDEETDPSTWVDPLVPEYVTNVSGVYLDVT